MFATQRMEIEMKEQVSIKQANSFGAELQDATNILYKELSNAIQNFNNDWRLPDQAEINNCIEEIYEVVSKLEQHAQRLEAVTSNDQVYVEGQFVGFCGTEMSGTDKEILENYFSDELNTKIEKEGFDMDDAEAVSDFLHDLGYWVYEYKFH